MRSVLLGFAACLILGPLLSAASAAEGSSPGRLFAEANSLYDDGEYEKALNLYEEIMAAGWEAPELYYNASNCYVRMGRPGYALVMIKRAARLAPDDEDISANLDFIRALIHEGAPEPESSRLLAALLSPYRILSIDGAFVLASVSLFALAAVASIRIVFYAKGRLIAYLTAAVALALVVSTAALGGKLWEDLRTVEAVVVAGKTEVRSGPGEDFVVQTSLGEGAEVSVKREGESWTEVRLGPDLAGWVRSSDLEII